MLIYRERGDSGRALELLQAHLQRQPASELGREWLHTHWLWQQNDERADQVLLEWAAELPPSRRLLHVWIFDSQLPAKRPEETRRLVEAIPRMRPVARQRLCWGLGLLGDPWRATALSCLAELAGSADSGVWSPALASLTHFTEEGGNQELFRVLSALPPESRARALARATMDLGAPGECPAIVDWLERSLQVDTDGKYPRAHRRRPRPLQRSAAGPRAFSPAARRPPGLRAPPAHRPLALSGPRESDRSAAGRGGRAAAPPACSGAAVGAAAGGARQGLQDPGSGHPPARLRGAGGTPVFP